MRSARVARIARALSGALGLVLAACAKDPAPVVLTVTSGLDGTPFDGTPPVRTVELRLRATDGGEQALAKVPVSASSLDLPDAARTGIGALVLAGLGDGGVALVYGRSPAMELAGLDAPLVPIRVMVQRHATVARALTLPSAAAQPRAAVLGARYLVVGDGRATRLHVVDLLSLSARAEDAALSVKPATLAIAGAFTLAIDATGQATLVDLDAGTASSPAAPSGASFADVASGAVVTADDGAAWLVGATRGSPETAVVMRLSTDGTLSAVRLGRARAGAASTWVTGRGLVVAGGSGDGAGAEVIAPGATAASALPFAADATKGALVAALDATTVVRLSPDGTVSKLDLACAASCAPTPVALKLNAVTPREGDAVVVLESSILVVRGGGVGFLDRGLTLLRPVWDAGSAVVAAARLPTGVVALVTAGDAVLRTALGDPR